MAIYQKNDMKKGEPIDTKKLEDYLTLYINFKLKVREAEELGFDTVTSFVTELKGYRDQLAKPYFTDEATIDRLVREAYDREHFDLRTGCLAKRYTGSLAEDFEDPGTAHERGSF
jgi:peptidyl-prolyl cis-trans isomerase SurA